MPQSSFWLVSTTDNGVGKTAMNKPRANTQPKALPAPCRERRSGAPRGSSGGSHSQQEEAGEAEQPQKMPSALHISLPSLAWSPHSFADNALLPPFPPCLPPSSPTGQTAQGIHRVLASPTALAEGLGSHPSLLPQQLQPDMAPCARGDPVTARSEAGPSPCPQRRGDASSWPTICVPTIIQVSPQRAAAHPGEKAMTFIHRFSSHKIGIIESSWMCSPTSEQDNFGANLALTRG